MPDGRSPAQRPRGHLPRLLVVGFSPFQNYDRNPAGEIAAALDGQVIAAVRVHGQRIPTTWRGSWEALRSAVAATKPDGLVCLGIAPEHFIRLETQARNLVIPEADVAGELVPPSGQFQIEPSAPELLETTLPLHELAAQLDRRREILALERRDAVESRFWYNAGGFICNYLFFKMLYEFGSSMQFAGLVHIPRLASGSETERPDEDEVLSGGSFIVESLAQSLRNRM